MIRVELHRTPTCLARISLRAVANARVGILKLQLDAVAPDFAAAGWVAASLRIAGHAHSFRNIESNTWGEALALPFLRFGLLNRRMIGRTLPAR